MAGFGQPSFAGVYGGMLGGTAVQTTSQNGGPDYEITSPMAGGTQGDSPTTVNADAAKYGLLGEPLSWWFLVVVILVGMSLLGASKG